MSSSPTNTTSKIPPLAPQGVEQDALDGGKSGFSLNTRVSDRAIKALERDTESRAGNDTSPSSAGLLPAWLADASKDFTKKDTDRTSSTASLPSSEGSPPTSSIQRIAFRSSSGRGSPLNFRPPPETPYFPRTIPEADHRICRTKESAGLAQALSSGDLRGPSRTGSPLHRHRRRASFSADDTLPRRTTSAPNPRLYQSSRSPSWGSIRRASSNLSFNGDGFDRDPPSTPPRPPSRESAGSPVRPPSRRSASSPVRPLSKNSRSFGPARPVTAPPPAASGEAPRIRKGAFFKPDALFTRCLTGDLRPDQIISVSGPGKDAFISTTEDYEHAGIGVRLPDDINAITWNDSEKLITTLSLNDEYEDSVKSNGVWFLAIGLGAKIAIPTERKSETYQKFQEVSENAQCGLTASTNSREWVMAEDEEFFKKNVRSGHIKIYKIDPDGRTERWTFAGPELKSVSEIKEMPIAKRSAMARRASTTDVRPYDSV